MLVRFNWRMQTITSYLGICDFGLPLLERMLLSKEHLTSFLSTVSYAFAEVRSIGAPTIGALHLSQKSLVHRPLYCEFSQKVVSYRIVILAEKHLFFAWKPHFLPILSPYVPPFLRIEPANVIPVAKATNPVDFLHDHPHPDSLVGRLAVSW
jgi:hypothetical protein